MSAKRTSVIVYIDSDYHTLGLDATQADLDGYAENLAALLAKEFERAVEVEQVLGGERAGRKCEDDEIEEYVRELESSEDWLALLPPQEGTRRRRGKTRGKKVKKQTRVYLPIRSSKFIRQSLEWDHQRRVRWATELESHGTLYRARDGRLWGLKALRGKEEPGWFIEYVGKTEHNPLGEVYPQSWQQLEDEHGLTDWLHDEEQELIMVEFLESVKHVPTEPHTWERIERKPEKKAAENVKKKSSEKPSKKKRRLSPT